jgi:hypothetical protein
MAGSPRSHGRMAIAVPLDWAYTLPSLSLAKPCVGKQNIFKLNLTVVFADFSSENNYFHSTIYSLLKLTRDSLSVIKFKNSTRLTKQKLQSLIDNETPEIQI